MRSDNEVWALIITALSDMMIELGLPCVVQQAYQPTQQGVPTEPTLAVNSITSTRYGFPEDTSYYDEGLDEIVQRQSYWLERTYQVEALAIQNPQTPGSPTAFDYLDAAAAILQTEKVVQYFTNNGIGILRIQPLRVIYIVDDRDQHEQVPSFDFTLSYQQILLSTAVPITEITAEIYEV